MKVPQFRFIVPSEDIPLVSCRRHLCRGADTVMHLAVDSVRDGWSRTSRRASRLQRSFCVVTDQGTEKWLLTSRWMLWLAPAGLRGGLKLEAYHQSRQPQSFFLCGPRCSGTSDRCSGRCGVISYALLRQPYLRPRRCGDLGFVSRHKPAEHHVPMFLQLQALRRHVSRPVAAGVPGPCDVSNASCCGSGSLHLFRRCGVLVASC